VHEVEGLPQERGRVVSTEAEVHLEALQKLSPGARQPWDPYAIVTQSKIDVTISWRPHRTGPTIMDHALLIRRLSASGRVIVR
jgi:hypothetical protein